MFKWLTNISYDDTTIYLYTVFMGNWVQDSTQMPGSMDAQVTYS